jgi:hypothetical protein
VPAHDGDVTAASRTTASPRPTLTAGRVAARAGLVVAAAGGVLLGAGSGFGLLWFIPYTAVGTLLVLRRKGGAIGWLLLALAWAHVIAAAPVDATPAEIAAGTAPAGQVLLAIAGGGPAGPGLFLLYFALTVVFPSGHLPKGRWRSPTAAVLAIGALIVAATAFAATISLNWAGSTNGQPIPNPIALAPGSPFSDAIASEAVSGAFAVLMVGGIVGLVARFRRSAGVERQQLRWIVAALGFVMVAVVGGFAAGSLVPAIGDAGLQWIAAIVAFPCVPVAIGVAILRYRLYDIDRIISRTLSWAILTGGLGGIFALLVVGLQSLLAAFTGADTLAVAASTLVVAALFQPLRGRVQRAVDRRFDRARYDGERLAAAFAARLRDEADLTTVGVDLTGTAHAALVPASIALWVRARDKGG